jgi:hypothetical protein
VLHDKPLKRAVAAGYFTSRTPPRPLNGIALIVRYRREFRGCF